MSYLLQDILTSIKYRSTIIRYYIFFPILYLFWKFPKAETIEETLKKLKEEKYSISRFGDGELDIMWGATEGFQKADRNLGYRLKEILNSNEPNILIGIADFYHKNSNNREKQNSYAKQFCIKNLPKIIRTFKRKEFANAYISRPITTYKNIDAKEVFEQIKKIWEKKDLYVVEGDKCRCGIGNDLFALCKSVKRIICPSENAYDKYQDILSKCKELIPKEAVVYLALGPTASILAYDLGKEGYKALDLGHLDIEYEYMKHGAIDGQRIKIPGKYVNEIANGCKVDDSIINEAYINSIICKIN